MGRMHTVSASLGKTMLDLHKLEKDNAIEVISLHRAETNTWIVLARNQKSEYVTWVLYGGNDLSHGHYHEFTKSGYQLAWKSFVARAEGHDYDL